MLIITFEEYPDAGVTVLIDATLGHDFIRDIKVEVDLGAASAADGDIGIDVFGQIAPRTQGGIALPLP